MKISVMLLLGLLAVFAPKASGAADDPNTTSVPEKQPRNLPPATDQAPPLPFPISDAKKLSPEELAEKSEGTYVTGLPQINVDPLTGFGYGADGYLYFNGSRSDPFFAYTPYRAELQLHAFNTTRSAREFTLGLDVPYILESKYRLRISAVYEDNPTHVFFGTTTASLNALSFDGQRASNYDDYQNILAQVRPGGPGEPALVTNYFYNTYGKREIAFNASLERNFLDGELRVLAGFEVGHFSVYTFDGRDYPGSIPGSSQTEVVPNAKTLLTQQINANQVIGGHGGFVNLLQFGVIYDTRDLEPDPARGIFAELTDEFGFSYLGSSFNFNKTFFQIKHFIPVFLKYNQRLVFAWRFGVVYTAAGAPFFEYQDAWGSEKDVVGLGGEASLRGYKTSRFLGRMMNFINLELRYRFYDFSVRSQHFAFYLMPFFDIGGVWDSPWQYTFKNYRYNEGVGARIAWNQSTVIRADYAVSQEDSQFFFGFDNTF